MSNANVFVTSAYSCSCYTRQQPQQQPQSTESATQCTLRVSRRVLLDRLTDINSSFYNLKLFCGRPNKPQYGSCPSVRPSVSLSVPNELITKKNYNTQKRKQN